MYLHLCTINHSKPMVGNQLTHVDPILYLVCLLYRILQSGALYLAKLVYKWANGLFRYTVSIVKWVNIGQVYPHMFHGYNMYSPYK